MTAKKDEPTNKPIMVKIKRNGNARIQPPGYSVELFRRNPQLFEDLKEGKEIEVPYEVATLLIGVTIVTGKIETQSEETPIEEGDKDGKTGSMGN